MTSPIDVGVRLRVVENELGRDLGVVRRDFAATIAEMRKSGGAAGDVARNYDKLAAASLRAGRDAGSLNSALVRQQQHAGILSGSLTRLAAGYGAIQVGKFAVDAVTGFQNAQVALDGLLGSQKEANDLIGQLQVFAKETPYNFQQLLGQAQMMLATGTAVGQVVPNIKAMADAVAQMGGSRDQLQSVALTMSQIANSPTVSGQDLRQLVESGHLDPYTILAKANGMSRQQFQAQLNSGQLRIDGQKAAAQLLAGFEEKAPDAAKRLSKTLGGQLSNLVDTLQMSLAKGLAPELPQMTAFVETLGKELPGIASVAGVALRPFGDVLGIMAAHPHLTEALGGFLLLRTAVGPAFQLAAATREIAAGIVLINAAQGGGGLSKALLLSTLGLDGGIRTAGAAASAESAAASAAVNAGGAAAGSSAAARAAGRVGRVGKYGARGASAALAGYAISTLYGAGTDMLQAHFGHADDGSGFHWQDPAKIVLGADKFAASSGAAGFKLAGPVGGVAGLAGGWAIGAGKGLWDFAHHRRSYSMSDAGKRDLAVQQEASSLLGGVQINVHGSDLDAIMRQLAPQLRVQLAAAIKLSQQQGASRKQVPYP